MTPRTTLSSLLLATLITTAAHAEAPSGGVYDAAFFSGYAPQTALDMINHTPGFTLKNGSDRRGFSGALGDVLIDGQRPIIKNQTLEDVLKLIPAAQVLRIEVLTGDTVAGDPSGEPVLANVVRVTSTGSGYASAGGEYANRHRMAPNGFISWTGRHGVMSYSLGASTYSLIRDQVSDYTNRDAGGALLNTGVEHSPRFYYEAKLNGQASRRVAGGLLSVTGQAMYSRYHEDPRRSNTDAGGVSLGGQATPYTESTAVYELGGQYTRDLGPWRLDLSGFLNRKHFFSGVTASQIAPDASIVSVFHQGLDRQSGETIARAQMTRDLSPSSHIELGAEVARNSMDGGLVLTFTAGGVSYPIPVPDSNSRIVEDRSEVYASYVRDLSSDLGLEARLTREASALTFRGDTNQVVHLAFLKPSLTVTRRFGGGNQLVLHIYRDADQIDFNDFLSAESLKDSVLNGGNPDLRPQTSWRSELSGDWHFGPRTALNLKLYHYALSDTADLVPVTKDGVIYDAPGNIGKGRIDGISANLTLPLDRLLPKASLTLNMVRQTSRVTDPVTGRARPLSNLPTYSDTVTFRQDFPKHHLAWGFDYTDADYLTKYQLTNLDTTRASPMLNLYVERSQLGAFTIRATLNSATDAVGLRRREFYLPDRSGALDHVETQVQPPDRWLNFTLSRGF